MNSSSKNVLLMKADIGKAKPSLYNLPNQNFSYGKAYIKDKEGAKEGTFKKILKKIKIKIFLVSMTWKYHEATKDPSPNVNFAKLNKEKVVGNKSNVLEIVVKKLFKFFRI